MCVYRGINRGAGGAIAPLLFFQEKQNLVFLTKTSSVVARKTILFSATHAHTKCGRVGKSTTVS